MTGKTVVFECAVCGSVSRYQKKFGPGRARRFCSAECRAKRQQRGKDFYKRHGRKQLFADIKDLFADQSNQRGNRDD